MPPAGELVISHSVLAGIPIYSAGHTQSNENTQVAAAIPSSITPATAHLGDRTHRHIALRLLPFLFILYIANYLDRTGVAYAAIGMSRDLGFSDRVFGLGAGISFISYVALQIPGALLFGTAANSPRTPCRRRGSCSILSPFARLDSYEGCIHHEANFASCVLGAGCRLHAGVNFERGGAGQTRFLCRP